MTPLPQRLDGKTRLAQTLNQLIQCVREQRAIQNPNARVSVTTRGTIQLPGAQRGSASVESSQPVWQ